MLLQNGMLVKNLQLGVENIFHKYVEYLCCSAEMEIFTICAAARIMASSLYFVALQTLVWYIPKKTILRIRFLDRLTILSLGCIIRRT